MKKRVTLIAIPCIFVVALVFIANDKKNTVYHITAFSGFEELNAENVIDIEVNATYDGKGVNFTAENAKQIDEIVNMLLAREYCCSGKASEPPAPGTGIIFLTLYYASGHEAGLNLSYIIKDGYYYVSSGSVSYDLSGNDGLSALIYEIGNEQGVFKTDESI